MAHAYGQLTIDLIRLPVTVIGNDRGAEQASGSRPHPKASLETSDLVFAGQHAGHVGVDPFEASLPGWCRHDPHHKSSA